MLCRDCGKEMMLPLTPDQVAKLNSLPWLSDVTATPEEESEIARATCYGHTK